MLNLKDWLGSKKTKDMLFGEGLLLIVMLIVLYMSGGKPEAVKALLAALIPLLVPMFGLIGVKIGAQGIADLGRPKPQEYELEAGVQRVKKATAEAEAERHIQAARERSEARTEREEKARLKK